MAEEKDKTTNPGSENPGSQAVWTYRGYQLRSSEFTTAMVHLFRAEVQRANVWRQRLDTTTNWAVVTTGAVISFAFGESFTSHLVILLDMVLVTMFLVMEARRYRYYELWSYRVRLMETDFFAAMLVPPFHPSPDWAEALAENMLHPTYPITIWEAFGRRLRRNYLWIYLVVGLAWIIKIWLQPQEATNIQEFIQNAAVGTIPGEIILLIGITFILGLVVISLVTLQLHQAPGEVLPRYGTVTEEILAAASQAMGRGADTRAWFRPSRRRQQLLTFIITDKAQAVTNRILRDMHRGATSIPGTGMYTGEAHTVLMVALTITEVPQLRSLVSTEDPHAFVVVSPATGIFGGGFMPLQEE